ncbi:MAG: phytoene desaturase family protein, partial [Crocinitomicaceae bacterium]|nr:phytoene desaturase family protein [Crocinitomicaceae bacterium]
MKNAIVIGAGIGGIAASIRLARKGYSVKVFEASNYPGGKLSEFKMGDYRFDRGPSLFTLPTYVEELFELCNEKMSEHFSYSELPILCNYFYPDGFRFEAKGNREENIKAIVHAFDEDELKVRAFFSKAEFIYNTTAPLFLERPLKLPMLYKTKAFWNGILRIPQLPLVGSYTLQLKKYFKNPKTVQYFQRYATYNGSSPYKTPALMQLLPHVEQGIGAFIPDKGMYDITLQLFELAKRQGVEFVFNSNVEEIIIEEKRAVGIRFNTIQIETANVVVSNMDVFPTYKKLLPKEREPKVILNQEKSSSALIFYWGLKGYVNKSLSIHNIFFSADYIDEFRNIFETETLANDLTVYVHVTSKHIASDAPENGENWFVMVNAPNNKGQNWDEIVTRTRENIIKKLESMLGEGFEDKICCEHVWTPRGIEADTSSHLGALYGNASNSASAAFFRHANNSSRIKDLYFVGGSVH